MENLNHNLDSWDKAYALSLALKFVTWPRQKVESKAKEKAKEIRDQQKKKLTKVLDKILFCDSQEANQDIYDMYFILKKLKDLIFAFVEEFTKRKREKTNKRIFKRTNTTFCFNHFIKIRRSEKKISKQI